LFELIEELKGKREEKRGAIEGLKKGLAEKEKDKND